MGNQTGIGKSWADNYKDPRWQKKRLEIMERDEFKCSSCGSTDKTLNVHHAYYNKGKMPWEYPSRSLTTLCEDCHKKRHQFQKLMLTEIGILTASEHAGLFHLLCIGGGSVLLGAIHNYPASNDFVDYSGLSEVVRILSETYEIGIADGE